MNPERIHRSRAAAAALAIFAGGFGAHRFFLGQWWGVFYLLLCWTYIPFLIAIIEGIVFMANGQEAWDRKYNDGISAGREPMLVIAIFVLMIPLIAALGIVLAIAIPAYHDYTVRTKTAEALQAAGAAKLAIAEFVANERRWPDSLEEARYQPVGNAYLQSARFDPQRGLLLQINAGGAISGEVLMTPEPSDGGLVWHCQSAGMDERYLPSSCR